MSKTILVTGGCGFIGSHLCQRLLEEGHHVICLDNLMTGNKQNISPLRHNPKYRDRFEFIRHDVTEKILLEVDQIYHLACPASPPSYQINGIKTIKTNVLGTLNMCGLAKRTGARLLLSSTSEIYGNPTVTPQSEDYWGNVNPIGPRSCYDEGKRISESLLIEYHRHCDVEIRIARIFNTYGPNLNPEDGRVISNLMCQAIKKQDLTIYGDGSQTRSFCYIDDLVDGLIKLMNCDYSLPINLGNPNEITIKQLAEKIINLQKDLEKINSNNNSNIIYKNLPTDDPTNRKPDITLAKKHLGWTPSVSLEEGLLKTWKYYQQILTN